MLFRLAYWLTDQRALIDADTKRWGEVQGHAGELGRLVRAAEFRSLLYHRLSHGNQAGRIYGAVLRRVRPGERTLFLSTNSIGPGLFIQHGFATIVSAQSVGANCWINQQVTIGFDETLRAPVIEDGARVHAGAIVIGPVTVGRGAIIGAGAVVTKDVPAGMVAVGVAASCRLPTKSAQVPA